MINSSEKKLYKVLRNVGIKRYFIKRANKLDDLYLDEFDYKLLVYYFETEFGVTLTEKDIKYLKTLPAFYKFIHKKAMV